MDPIPLDRARKTKTSPSTQKELGTLGVVNPQEFEWGGIVVFY